MCYTNQVWSSLQTFPRFLSPPYFLHPSFSQSYHQLPEVPLVQPKIGIIWSFSQNYHQLPEVPLVQPKIGITWSCSQNYYQLLAKFNFVRQFVQKNTNS